MPGPGYLDTSNVRGGGSQPATSQPSGSVQNNTNASPILVVDSNLERETSSDGSRTILEEIASQVSQKIPTLCLDLSVYVNEGAFNASPGFRGLEAFDILQSLSLLLSDDILLSCLRFGPSFPRLASSLQIPPSRFSRLPQLL